jgi:hypothetical protein
MSQKPLIIVSGATGQYFTFQYFTFDVDCKSREINVCLNQVLKVDPLSIHFLLQEAIEFEH